MVTFIDSVIIVGYVLLMVTVGSYFARRQGTSETFFLADRTLGPFHVFGTTFSTFFGTGLVFTLSSFGYRYGVGAFVLPGAAVIPIRTRTPVKSTNPRRASSPPRAA